MELSLFPRYHSRTCRDTGLREGQVVPQSLLCSIKDAVA